MSDRIGFIAGGGSLPVVAIKNAVKKGFSVFVAGFKNITDEKLYSSGVFYKEFKLGEIGKLLDYFADNDVKKVILLGYVSHINVFRDLKPDLKGLMLITRIKDKTPLGIFRVIEDEFKKYGISIISPIDFLKDNIAKEGIICGKLSDDDLVDIKYGFNIAKKIAEMDIGLTVVVKDRCVIAVEALEGTDECIKRAGEILGRRSDFVMVKVSRPKQDMRFDLPVIGGNTVRNVYNAGGKVIAIESHKTIIVDIDETISIAKKYGITIFGIR